MMSKTRKILVIEDELVYQIMLKAILDAYTVLVAGSGEEALEVVEAFAPDLIVLDVNLPGIDGYETCQRLRALGGGREVPVLFESAYRDLEDRLRAYGVGGDDYIAKPFDATDLEIKVSRMLAHKARRDELTGELCASYRTIQDAQVMSARIQSINRFAEACLFCHDYNALFAIFFKTLRELESSCVLRLVGASGDEMRADTGTINQLEREILELAHKRKGRITRFGKDRAVFNWSGRCLLLVRNVGENIDTIAIAMNALESGLRAIDTESQLLDRVKRIESDNQLIRDRIHDEFTRMNGEIRTIFLSLSLASELAEEEEDHLHDFVDRYADRANELLSRLSANNREIVDLIVQLRTPPKEVSALLDASLAGDEESGSDVCLF